MTRNVLRAETWASYMQNLNVILAISDSRIIKLNKMRNVGIRIEVLIF
jgi:hypothetical protein